MAYLNDQAEEQDTSAEESTEEENEEESSEESTEDTDDSTDWKAEAEKLKGINQRLKTKLEKAGKPKESKATPQDKQTGELDYGQKAFLKAYDIDVTDADELNTVKDYLSAGKSLDEIVNNKHFKNDLSDIREKKAVKAATPSTSKRSSNSVKDNVDYWIKKGELPPSDNPELRRKVLNERISREKNKNKFSSTPIVNAFGG